MRSMDRARRVGGLLWLAGGLVFQLLWLLLDRPAPGPLTWLLVIVISGLGVTTMVRAEGPRWLLARWLLGWAAAVLLGLDFAGAVADRFGLLGSPGAAGVSWGSWPGFVDYTAELLPGFARPVVVVAAGAATVVEVALSLLLVSGWRRRWVGKAAAGLLLTYLVAMGGALGADAVARYALPVLIGGALLVSSCPSGRPHRSPSVDAGTASVVRRKAWS